MDEQTLIGGLTSEELEVMNHLVDAWNKFLSLDRGIPYDSQHAFQTAIHEAQAVLGQFALERTFPEYWGRETRK